MLSGGLLRGMGPPRVPVTIVRRSDVPWEREGLVRGYDSRLYMPILELSLSSQKPSSELGPPIQ